MQETALSKSRAESQPTGFDSAPRNEAGLGPLAELALETAARSDLDDVALRHVLQALPVAVYTTDAEGRINYFNDAAVVLSGRTPRLGGDKWCVSWRMYTVDGTPLPHDQCPMATTLMDRVPVRGVAILAERPDGTRVPVMPYPTPLYDRSGAFAGALAPFRGAGRLIRTAGSDVGLSSKQALGLSLALHELATNAVKYGALSRKEGSVGVAWGLDPGNKAKEVYLTWTEADGPPVVTPDRQGFGTRLMQRVLADELGGEVTLDYRPEGLVCAIRFPVWSEAQ